MDIRQPDSVDEALHYNTPPSVRIGLNWLLGHPWDSYGTNMRQALVNQPFDAKRI